MCGHSAGTQDTCSWGKIHLDPVAMVAVCSPAIHVMYECSLGVLGSMRQHDLRGRWHALSTRYASRMQQLASVVSADTSRRPLLN